MNVMQGDLRGEGLRVGVVVSRFNDFITRRLLEGAEDGLLRHGVAPEDIDVAWVPGAVEIPLTAERMAASGRYAAVIALGAVIRGATGHYEHVCSMVASGLARAALDAGLPVIFGVLTTDTLEQAVDRAGGKVGNKGFDAAVSAIEMASLLTKLEAAGRHEA